MDGDRLLRRAKKGTLEVEHLLAAARTPSPSLAAEIDVLIRELGWQAFEPFPNVPWFEWCTVVKTYCLEGLDGLARLGSDPRYLSLVVGLAEELRGLAGLRTLIRLLPRFPPSTHISEAKKIAAGLNVIGMRRADPELGPNDWIAIRDFLHDILASSDNDAVRGTTMCALRYFGDESSLPILGALPVMQDVWEPARAGAATAIRRRLRRPPAARH